MHNIRIFQGKSKRIYRRVGPHEEDRGEAYPCCSAGISQLAHFGLGVGVYYMQLIIQGVVFVIGGLVLVPVFMTYASDAYGDNSPDPRLFASGSCPAETNVTASLGCPYGAPSCTIGYRSACELTKNAIVADIGMSIVILLFLFLAKVPEKELLEQLDEAVQTLQDYSIVVCNPPRGADNPDEWREFMSRFGTVRLVTVVRKNAALCELLLEVHRELQHLSLPEEERDHSCTMQALQCLGLVPTDAKRKARLEVLQKKLEAACRLNYDVSRVFVTFDMEEHQRLCLQELEVPNVELFWRNANMKVRLKFRGESVLDVKESPEFDNIHWQNLEVPAQTRLLLRLLALLLTFAALVACFYFINWMDGSYHDQLPIAIALADMAMPVLFEAITDLEEANDEDDRQDSLLVKLFMARLLITILFPYILTSWSEFLNDSNVINVVNTQLAACFISPFINALDIYGFMKRHVAAFLLSDTQQEVMHYWQGSDWTLAERYTNLAKIIFLSIFYSLLTPISVFIGAVAFALVFLVDRFLLLRRWHPPKMLDATMASRVRHMTVLAVAAHMYATCRFVYSWPMDEAHTTTSQLNNSNSSSIVYEKVDKNPPYNILTIDVQPWHSTGQTDTVIVYKWATVAVLAFCIYILFGSHLVAQLRALFFSDVEVSGDVVGIPFFSVPKIGCYCPHIEADGETFITADTSQAMDEFKPAVFNSTNLSLLVPENARKHVLSSVKWYGLGYAKLPGGGHLGALLHQQDLEGKQDSHFSTPYLASSLLTRKSAELPALSIPHYSNDRFDANLQDSLLESGQLRQKPGGGGGDVSMDAFNSPIGELHPFDSQIDISRQMSEDGSPHDGKHGRRRRKVKRQIQPIDLAPVVVSKRRLSDGSYFGSSPAL